MNHPPHKARWSDRGRFVVPFIDLQAQYRSMKSSFDEAVARVLQRQWFLFGEEVAAFEEAWSERIDGRPCLSCGSGTDALTLCLRALGIGAGDRVLLPAFTFAATAVAVMNAGATPVFCDVNRETRCLDGACLASCRGTGIRAVVAVHLFGTPAPMDEILRWARSEGALVVEDACQGHGARWQGHPVGSLGDGAAFSFYPGKNLGGVADGGAVAFDDPGAFERARELANYGLRGQDLLRAGGMNSRLCELSAAILNCKLDHLEEWIELRSRWARRYDEGLKACSPKLRLPRVPEGGEAGWHAYVVEVGEGRDALLNGLMAAGIEGRIHYGKALPDHSLFADGPAAHVQDWPVSRGLARKVLSLPLYPEMGVEGVDRVCQTLAQLVASS